MSRRIARDSADISGFLPKTERHFTRYAYILSAYRLVYRSDTLICGKWEFCS